MGLGSRIATGGVYYCRAWCNYSHGFEVLLPFRANTPLSNKWKIQNLLPSVISPQEMWSRIIFRKLTGRMELGVTRVGEHVHLRLVIMCCWKITLCVRLVTRCRRNYHRSDVASFQLHTFLPRSRLFWYIPKRIFFCIKAHICQLRIIHIIISVNMYICFFVFRDTYTCIQTCTDAL